MVENYWLAVAPWKPHLARFSPPILLQIGSMESVAGQRRISGVHYGTGCLRTGTRIIRRFHILPTPACETTISARCMHTFFSLPTSARVNQKHNLSWYLQWRLPARVWQWLFFKPGEFEDQAGQSAQWNRGAYLAGALAHCGECHTPRNAFGVTQNDFEYAGTADGPEGEKVPNITSSKTSGIGDWSHGDLVNFLRFGELPDGEYASGTMEPVLEGLANLTEPDRNALIEFLQSVPPIDKGNL